MDIDFLPYLKLALRELEKFSIPGIGTFVREQQQSKIDTARSEIYPPEENIRIEPGEQHLRPLRDLFSDKLGIDAQQAEHILQSMGKYLIKRLQNPNTLEITGLGRIILRSNGQYEFEKTTPDPTLKAFGLLPVKIPPPHKPKESALRTNPNYQTLPPVTEQPISSGNTIKNEKSKSSRQWLIIFLLIMLFILVVLLILMLTTDFFKFITTEKKDSTQTTIAAATTTQKEPNFNFTPAESKSGTENNTTNSEKNTDNKIFYILVGKPFDTEAAATEAIKNWKEKKLNPKVTFFEIEKQYRISLFSSENRQEIQQKLRELKPVAGDAFIHIIDKK
jgi:flagellar basal body-associated protein FliL